MKKLKNVLKRIATTGLAVVMLVAQTPATAFAAEEQLPVTEAIEDIVIESAGDIITGADDEAVTEATDAPDKDGNVEEISEDDTEDEEAVTSDDGISDDGNTDASDIQDEDKKEADTSEEEKEDEKSANKEDGKMPVFEESQSISGVKITVTAEEGVFPEDAELSVKRAGYADRKQAEEAVEDARDE